MNGPFCLLVLALVGCRVDNMCTRGFRRCTPVFNRIMLNVTTTPGARAPVGVFAFVCETGGTAPQYFRDKLLLSSYCKQFLCLLQVHYLPRCVRSARAVPKWKGSGHQNV